MARGRKPPIPVTLIVGPTGAGKTKLINRLLRDPAFTHTAVILNDFGTTALEASVVDKAEDDILSLGAGCVCCSVRGALTDGLERLLRALDNGRIQKIGRVVIEAAETAGPAAVVAAIAGHPYLSMRFNLDGIVAVLGDNAVDVLATRADIVHQVAIADVIAARDTGLAIPNATALVLDAATAAPTLFTGHGPFDPETGDVNTWLGTYHAHRATGLSGEAAEIQSFAVRRAGVFPPGTLDRFLGYVLALQGSKVIRLRAAVALGPSDIMVAESYGTYFLPPFVIEQEDAVAIGLRFVVSARGFGEATFVAYLDAFLNEARIDAPDRQALAENPLSIAGFSARGGN